MKVVALTNFRDIDDFTKSYVEGESYEFPDGRARKLINSGLVKAEGESIKKGDEDISLSEAEIDSRLANLIARENAVSRKELELGIQAEESENVESESDSQQLDTESIESDTKEKKSKGKK